jgi:hypothetical protein
METFLLPCSKLQEDDHNNLQLGLGLAVSDVSPYTADKLKSDFGGRFPTLEIRRLQGGRL